jgi:DNA-binding transcriptional LysR family regulator
VDLLALKIFLTVAEERSFSRAATKVHRTQPAVSQAVHRLEKQLGEQVFDRSSKTPSLTEAGQLLKGYGERLLKLIEETESAVRELRDLRRGRVVIGTNEAGVHTLLPLIAAFRAQHPRITLEVRRVQARQVAAEVQQGGLDIGVLTFRPPDEGLRIVPIGSDELVLLVPPSHPFATRDRVTMPEMAAETIVAHNEPSPVRDRVLRLFERRQLALNITMSLPSLDGIKRAVEMELGVALLPRRCAITELARGQLVAVHVVGLSRQRGVFLLWRESSPSLAVRAFVAVAQRLRGSHKAADPSLERDGGSTPA